MSTLKNPNFFAYRCFCFEFLEIGNYFSSKSLLSDHNTCPQGIADDCHGQKVSLEITGTIKAQELVFVFFLLLTCVCRVCHFGICILHSEIAEQSMDQGEGEGLTGKRDIAFLIVQIFESAQQNKKYIVVSKSYSYISFVYIVVKTLFLLNV